MATREANGGIPFAGVALALVGLLLLAGGGALFLSQLSFAGYGIWILVWGLAFLIGALSRLVEVRA